MIHFPRAPLSCVLLLLLLGCSVGDLSSDSGDVVFGIAAIGMLPQGLLDAQLTVMSLEVRDASGAWTPVPTSAQAFDLHTLAADGTRQMLAHTRIPRGRYDRVRLGIGGLILQDADGVREASIATREVELPVDFTVGGDGIAMVVTIVDISSSLDAAEDGYSFSLIADTQTSRAKDAYADEDGVLQTTPSA